MIFTPQVYPLSFSSNVQRNTLEYSNQVILPPEILASLPNYAGTVLFFTIANEEKKINIGVHEFTDIPDVCYIPYYFMMLLGIKEGDRVQIDQIAEEPQKATAITLKPQEQAFIELNDPKVVLEYHMSRLYPIVSLGDVIRVYHNNVVYCLSISKLEPSNIVQTTNCDIILEFEEAHDYKCPETPAYIKDSESAPAINEEYSGDQNYGDQNYVVNSNDNTTVAQSNIITRNNRPFVPFQGQGHRLGSS